MTSVPFNVSIIDDIVIEDKKYFMLDINSSSLPADVTVGNPSQVIVTILDNDRKLCDTHMHLKYISHTCIAIYRQRHNELYYTTIIVTST